MGLIRADYLNQLQALLPLGSAWARNPDAVLTKLLDVFSEEFSRVDLRSWQLLDETDPHTCMDLFADWERIAGLPDICCGTDAATTLAQRRSRLVGKLTSTGGQSRQFFLDLAAKLGYTDTSITEFRPMSCGAPCDSAVFGTDWLFAWQFNVGDYIAIHTMTCDDPSDSPLRSWQSTELQCRLNQMKPAHTTVLMNWTMTQAQIDVVLAYSREDILGGAPVLHNLLATLPSAAYW